MSEVITETAAPKKRMLSGIKPSGDLTLGSYLGAVKNWAERANDYDCFYFMADLHAITVRQNPADLRRRTLEQLAQYIACGLDPEKNTLFIQSHVHQHAELGWVLDCYSMFGELSRMTQFKDKSAKNADNINGGLFTYPALMAADILLYQPDLLPVGEDQKQHVELCHTIARRFNGIYGDVFKLPEPFVPKVGARIMSLTNPAAKMSKSENEDTGRILLMDTPETIMRQFKRAITDSDTENCVRFDRENKPGVANLMTIYSAVTGKTFDGICGLRLRQVQARRGRSGCGDPASHPGGSDPPDEGQGLSGKRLQGRCREGGLRSREDPAEGLQESGLCGKIMADEKMTQEPDIYDREDQCRKAIRTVGKAVFMRLLVTALLIFVLIGNGMQGWVIGLIVFVLIINLTGMLPLVHELRKQRKLLKEILDEEE